MANINITETVLRDAQQSLLAAAMTLEDMLPILGAMDQVGYYSCEVWGGATFDACIRQLDEDPWDRLRRIRSSMPNTKLQMLFRGQSMLGFRPYADDLVEYFVQRAVSNGIDIIRVYDALNDIRNLETSVTTARKEGAHVQGALCYTTSPVHGLGYFVRYAKQLESLGADSICVKDLSGILTPYLAYDLVAALKRELTIPVQIHSHDSSGMASMVLLKSAEAGVGLIDTAISPLALGDSHPATESMVAAFEGTPYDTGLDPSKLKVVADYFQTLRQKYLANGTLNPKMLEVHADRRTHQVPGELLPILEQQLIEAGRGGEMDALLTEISQVRADCGYPPLVTPTSQIVGNQAVLNLVLGERYKTISKEFRSLIKGEYGRTPAAIDPAFRSKVIGSDKATINRPAEDLAPQLDQIRIQLPEKYNEQPEDLLTLALFPQVAPAFFQSRTHRLYGVDGRHGDEVTQVHPV